MSADAMLLLRFRHGCPVLQFTYDNNAISLLVALFASGKQITEYPSIPFDLLSAINASSLAKEWA